MSLDLAAPAPTGLRTDRPHRPPVTFIAPSRYVQGPGELNRLGHHVAPFGTSALVVTSPGAWARSERAVTEHAGGTSFTPHFFSGESTAADIDRGAEAFARSGAQMVVGLGGGKVIDTAKAVAHRVRAPMVIVPTLASTDAPCSSLSVVYDDDGGVLEYLFLERSPDLVLVDSAVVVQAPARFLAAGMADALSTRFESAAAAASGTSNCAGGRPSAAALVLGAVAWDVVREHGVSALRAARAGTVTPAVELVIEVNTLHSGLGFESGGYAGAHAIHNGLLTVGSTAGGLHGERVNFGVLTQLVLERRRDAELDEFITVTRALGLPATLAQLGAADGLSDEEVARVADRTCVEGEGIHHMPFPVTSAMVADAVRAADAYATAFLADRPDLS